MNGFGVLKSFGETFVKCIPNHVIIVKVGREGEREGERERGGGDIEREREREREREGGREGGRGRERGRERGMEGENEEERTGEEKCVTRSSSGKQLSQSKKIKIK